MRQSPALLAAALREARVVVSALDDLGWTLPTPCSSWSTRDVVNHVVATTTKFSLFAGGLTDSPRTPQGDLLGEHPLAAFEQCRSSSAEAWRSADLQRRCRLPFGTFTAAEAADINTFDVLVHTWDVAHALTASFEPSRRLTEVAYSVAARLVTPEAVAQGHYAPAVDGAPTQGERSWREVLVLTGRQPDTSVGVPDQR